MDFMPEPFAGESSGERVKRDDPVCMEGLGSRRLLEKRSDEVGRVFSGTDKEKFLVRFKSGKDKRLVEPGEGESAGMIADDDLLHGFARPCAEGGAGDNCGSKTKSGVRPKGRDIGGLGEVEVFSRKVIQ